MIGVFDSGMGGLTVVKEIFRILPKYQVLYFGDTAHGPYGDKSEKTIKKYACRGVEFLIKNGAELIIIACNTTSATAIDDLTKQLRVLLFEVVGPAVKKSIKISSNRKIGVIGTRATINSRIYQKFFEDLNFQVKLFAKATPLLVPLIEENWIKKPETSRVIKRYVYSLKFNQIDTLILACNHYPLLRKIIQVKIGRQVKIINPGEEMVREIKEFFKQNPKIKENLVKGSEHKFFVSDLTEKYQSLASQWLGQKIKLEEINN
ncbi:glutamate racemase [Patescibacteria group bacterium]|nr:glutamate racemase [Patescibacteria group bacterium]